MTSQWPLLLRGHSGHSARPAVPDVVVCNQFEMLRQRPVSSFFLNVAEKYSLLLTLSVTISANLELVLIANLILKLITKQSFQYLTFNFENTAKCSLPINKQLGPYDINIHQKCIHNTNVNLNVNLHAYRSL